MSQRPTALVTGASSGIGEATAITLQDNGFQVYAAARRVDRMAPLRDRGIEVVRLDVADDASMTQVVGRLGRVDALVNNAGYGSYGALEDVPMAEARRQVEVNVFGLARMCQLVLPGMRQRGSGRIVNISSIGGRFSEPMGGWYHATKYAVEALSDSLRLEVAPFGVHVSIIEPGPIRTEWGGIALDTLDEHSGSTAYAPMARALRRMHERTYASGAVGPEVVAAAILHAVSARRPRVRYVRPRRYGVALAALSLVPDRLGDAAISRMVR